MKARFSAAELEDLAESVMTHEEIARLAEMPLGTVKSNVARGAARMRELLAAYDKRDRG